MKSPLVVFAVALCLVACGSSSPADNSDKQTEDTDTQTGDTDTQLGDQDQALGDSDEPAGDSDNPPGDSGPSDPDATTVGAPTGGAVASLVIGAGGGTLISTDGRVGITVPPGALAGDTTISITPIENKAHGGIGIAYRFEPDGQTFAQPATLTFGFTPEELAGSSPEILGAAFQTAAGYWQWLGTPTVDAIANTIAVSTTHFTDMSLVRGVSITPTSANVDTNASLTISVLVCYPNSVNAQATQTFGNACSVANVAPSASMNDWLVNGVPGGNAANGVLLATSSGIVYSAPSVLPAVNPVVISASTTIGNRVVSLVTTVTIVEAYPSYNGTVTFAAQTVYEFGEADVTFTFWERRQHSTYYRGTGIISGDYQYRPDCEPVHVSLNLDPTVANGQSTFLEIRDSDAPNYPGTFTFALNSEPVSMAITCGLTSEPYEISDHSFRLFAYMGHCGDQGFPVYDAPDILIGNRLCDPFYDELGYEINYSISSARPAAR